MKTQKFEASLLTGRLSERDAKRYFSHLGWFAFIFMALSSSAVSIISRVAYVLSPEIYGHWLFGELLSPFAFYVIALPVALIPLFRLPRIVPDREKMPLSHWCQGLSICLFLMILGNYVSAIVLTIIESYTGVATQNPVEATTSKTPLWGTFVFVVVLAPVIEEIVFRKILCRRLLPLGEGYAVVLSSACFALVHGNFYQLFYAFTLGCFFSFIYIKTGKLRYTVLYHMAINFIGAFLSPIIYDKAELEALSETFVIHAGNILPLIGFLWFWLITTGGAVLGAFIIIKKRRSIHLYEGLIPPPEKRAFRCIITSSGVIASLALFSLILSASVFNQ